MKPATTRKESIDERKTSEEWRSLGYIELKVSRCNHPGWPDRWYKAVGLDIPAFWCEWKAETREPSETQEKIHAKLREQNEVVIVAHSRREFWDKVRDMQVFARL